MKDIVASRIANRNGSTCWEPPNTAHVSSDDDDSEARVRITWKPVQLENEIIAVFDERPAPGEQLEMAFRRKEQQLAAVFARLNAVDSLALQRRLNLSLSDDPIAERFGRLVVARRTRLLAFLADARRRIALRLSHVAGRHG